MSAEAAIAGPPADRRRPDRQSARRRRSPLALGYPKRAAKKLARYCAGGHARGRLNIPERVEAMHAIQREQFEEMMLPAGVSIERWLDNQVAGLKRNFGRDAVSRFLATYGHLATGEQR